MTDTNGNITATTPTEDWWCSAAADTHADAAYARAKELGWNLMSTNRCPRRLVYKPHLDEGCWCESHLNDHAATWCDPTYGMFVAWEPYGAYGDEVAELVAAAEADGLFVRIAGSVWNPPRTISILFCAPVPCDRGVLK